MNNQFDIDKLRIEQLNDNLPKSVNSLLLEIFYKEQNIPKEFIPLKADKQKWWCVKNGNQIVGIVATWELQSQWYCGRLAINKNSRGYGLGKKLLTISLIDVFSFGIDKVIIDARDITVNMVNKLGGKVTGEKSNFYGNPITPMTIYKKDFIILKRH